MVDYIQVQAAGGLLVEKVHRVLLLGSAAIFLPASDVIECVLRAWEAMEGSRCEEISRGGGNKESMFEQVAVSWCRRKV